MSRILAGNLAPHRIPAFLALTAGLFLAACSPGADYPSLFPAVHDIPPPRTDTPLDANQVQQATEDLITARDRLNTEAQGSQSKTAATNSPGSPAGKSSAKTSSAKSSSAKAAAGPAAPKKQPSTQPSGLPANGAAQTAGAESK